MKVGGNESATKYFQSHGGSGESFDGGGDFGREESLTVLSGLGLQRCADKVHIERGYEV